MADDQDIKLTAYGYPGDATPDYYSEHHIGDRDNQLTATQDHQSVALTESEREARFGVSGKSTGMSFTYEGKTYYDDDTAPESDRRIDVFDPSHPPDQPVSKQLKSAPRLLPQSAEQELVPSLADAPEPAEEKPHPKQERPVDTVRKNYPEYADLPDEKLIPKLQAIFPDVPKERLQVYATQPGGGKMIRQYQDRGKSPLELFRKYYPGLSSGDDEKDVEWLRTHFQPDMGPMQFKALADPPPPILTFIGHLYDQMTSGTVAAVEGLGKHPKQPIGTGSPLNKGVESGAQATLGKWEQFPKAAMDAMDNLQKKAGVYGWKMAASDWLTKNVAEYGGARDWFRNFVNNLNARGQQFEKQSQQLAGSIPNNAGGQIAGTIGQVIGQSPDVAVSFAAGTTGRAAALWGMMYESISAYGHAVENHQKNALLQGVTSAGFRQFAQYLINTGKGRIVSGIANSFATVADQEMEKWARGEPNDISKDGKAATVGLLVGLLVGKPQPKLDVLQTRDWGRPQVTPEVTPQSSILRNPDVLRETPSQIDMPGQQWEKFLPRKAVQEELIKAEEAHHNGDHDAAADYIDRGFSLMPDKDKRAVAQDFLDKVDALAGEPKKKTLSPEDQLFNDYYFSGFGFKPGRHNKFSGEKEEPSKLPRIEVTIDAANKSFYVTQDGKQIARFTDHKAAEDFALSMMSGGESFYSGVPFKSTADSIKKWFESNRPGLLPHGAPEYESEGAERAGAIIKSEEARSRAAANVIPSAIYRKAVTATGHKDPALDPFEKITGFRFGDPMERMDRFFHRFSKAELIQQFIDYQDEKPIKDPNARWMWENVIGPTYDAIEKRDLAYGIEYDHRDNYFYQLLTHPKNDLVRLKQSMARSGMGLTFTKPREMRLVERLALGHEMITINPIRLMQMRWWASERGIQKIRDLRQLEAEGLAFNASAKGKNIPAAKKAWVDPNNIFPTPDKQGYYVDPDIIPVLNNKFDPSDIFRSAGGPIFKFVAALKGTVAAKVSWSLFHPLHIMDITQADVATDAFTRVLAGKANWTDAANMALNEVPFVGSIPAATRAYLKYADGVNYLKGRLDFDQLTPDQQRDVKDFLDMGLVVDTSQERQMQFTKFIQENAPKWMRQGPVGWTVKTGLDVLGNPLGFNKWWFGTVTPRLKFASAMMRRDTLAKTRPDLFRATNRMERMKEFQQIHRDVEGRYGEMHYDNLLWPRMAKQLGTTFMLSLGWQLGMFRTMGDGVIDLTRNQAHWGEILKGWQTRDPAARHLITNRMVFTAAYVARGIAAGWAISYFVGGKKQPELWDGVYPVVGKDANGKDKRVNMQYFFKDVPAFVEYERMTGSEGGAATHMAMNKMQPMLMSVIQASLNRDYMNHVIGDLPARIGYVLGHGIEPISFENMQQPGMTDADKLMIGLGFAPSGRWTMRSDLENKIISQALEARNYGPLLDARDRYRQAFLSHDQEAIKSAHDELRKMDVTEKQIHALQKGANIPIGHKFFKQLLPAQQEQIWKEMSPGERKEYWPYVKKELKASGRIKM